MSARDLEVIHFKSSFSEGSWKRTEGKEPHPIRGADLFL